MADPCNRCGHAHDAHAACSTSGPVALRTLDEDQGLLNRILLDRYLVGGVIGRGLVGTVFEAQHLVLGRRVAVKVIRGRYAGEKLVAQVLRSDVKAALAVSHPCLVEVLDIGALDDGTPFIVTERLEGETFAHRLGRERFSLAASVDLVMQLLSVVAFIHDHRQVLRDLRPRNVYLAHRRGCRPLVKVMDFGLARLVPIDRVKDEWDAARSSRTVSGPDLGSVAHYLSPERAESEDAVIPASDLHLVATAFYEALTGERPFGGSTYEEIVSQVRSGAHAPLRERRGDVSPELSAFVSRGLSPNPRNRPASAKEMQDEFRALLGGNKKTSTRMLIATGAHTPIRIPDARESPRSIRAADVVFSAPISAPIPIIEDAASSDPLPKVAESESEVETQTKRELAYLEILRPLQQEEEDSPTQMRRFDRHAPIDEASAENHDRTVPPPAPVVEIEIDASSFDDPTIDKRPPPTTPPSLREDEETETMQLSPATRLRIDNIIAAHPPATSKPSKPPKLPKR